MRHIFKKPKGLMNRKVLQEYHRGEQDRINHKSPTPPKSGDARKAYINGYNSR